MPAVANPGLGLRVLTVLLLPGSVWLKLWRLKLTAALSRWRRESKWIGRGALGGAAGGLLLLAAGCLRRCAGAQVRELTTAMNSATSYREWKKAARALDELDEAAEAAPQQLAAAAATERRASGAAAGPSSTGAELAFENDTERSYGHGLLEVLHAPVSTAVEQGAVEDMMSALRAGLIHWVPQALTSFHARAGAYSLHGLAKARRQGSGRRVGLPPGAKQYIREVRRVLSYLTKHDYAGFPPQRKLVMLRETQLAMGRSALVLSGGAAIGCFHIGVVKTLLQRNLLPRVVVGSSAGAIVGGILATHTKTELAEIVADFSRLAMSLKFFSDARGSRRLMQFFRTGALMVGEELECTLRSLYGDLTFAEAYERTGRAFCVSICGTRPGDKPKVLCHLTAPHVVVWSAVMASSSFPGLFPARELLTRTHAGDFVFIDQLGPCGTAPLRRWRDGSLESDLPLQVVTELFNVRFFIVSQTNPHLIPLLAIRKTVASLPGGQWLQWVGRQMENEFKMRCGQVKMVMGSGLLFWGASLFFQDWTGREGDVTVACPHSWSRIARCLQNPTQHDFDEFMAAGQKAMWPVLPTLKCHCRVELELADCAARLQQQTRAENPGVLSALSERVAAAVEPPP